MFLKKLHRLKGMLSFQLTFWYALLFTISSMICLSVFYYRVSIITMEKTDEELLEELGEFAEIRQHAGISQVFTEIGEEGEDEELVFFQVVTSQGEVLDSMASESRQRFEIPPDILHAVDRRKGPVFHTLSSPGLENKVRLISGFISPGEIMHIGFSLEENEEYLEIFREMIGSFMIPLFFLSACLGWIMARKALQGVKEVTRTAVDIAAGAYDKRVQVKKSSEEINRLASTFNTMVDRLQEVVQGMREMTDNIAHDLRSPLARIRGIAEMTVTGEKSLDDYREMAISTIEESDTLIEMINTMLEITEAETGVGRLNSEEVDLNNLVRDAFEVFQPLAREKNIELSVSLPDACFVTGDRGKLQRLFANLLENAIKYTEDNGKIHVETARVNDRVEIKIRDTGTGIDEEDLPHIFKRFYRCDRSRSQPGTGLGLSLAKAIAEAFGGNISVESTLSQGSEFTVSFCHCR